MKTALAESHAKLNMLKEYKSCEDDFSYHTSSPVKNVKKERDSIKIPQQANTHIHIQPLMLHSQIQLPQFQIIGLALKPTAVTT